MKKLISILLLIGLLMSCKSTDEPTQNKEFKPIQLTVAQKARVSQDNDFAFDFLNNTIAAVDNSNVFVSPMSLSIALGMLRNGAQGETKTEIETALKMSGLSDEVINSYYKIMQTSLPQMDSKTDLSIANSIWYKEGFSVKPDFLKVNTDYFNAYIKALDFSNQQLSLDTINGWCARKTNNLIPKVLNEIDPDARMFLMNAVYFKGMWVKQFNPESTIDYTFANEKNQQNTVRMMVKEDTVSYGKNDLAQFVDLPYGNGAFSMTVILPEYGKTTSDVLQSLNSESFNAMINSMEERKVKLFLPRFKTKNTYILNDALKSMGIKKAFNINAELDRISELKPLFVSFVQQDTYVEVTEEGTKAAAITTIGIYTSSLPVEEIPYFVVNKPFIFLIREKSTGIILFIGKIGNVEKF
ncbi:Proteinase inhibitor I4 serpin [uncultured Paludibacter sp.]|uniref:Proteinase inhibitor I4 serpin n=1 Tax=uncultured Paludibacter sp. TaxID=497635 RepID=A0A653AEL9_9BACT|nr:Proteinase inhibitor I4 serpin [uncultured Paludibacter sp.]